MRDAAVDGAADVDQVEHPAEPCPDVGGAQPVEPALQREQLATGLALVEGGVLQGHTDGQPHVSGRFDHVVTRHDGSSGTSGRSNVHRIRTTVDFPAPFGPRKP